METKRLETILIIEDNEDHLSCTRDALSDANIVNRITVARDGISALDYLFRRNGFANPLCSPRPAIILLDVRLPGIDGLDVLEQIKKDPSLKNIPVILLSSTDDREDLRRAAELGINDFIRKPLEYDEFKKKVHALGVYWSRVSNLT